MKRLILFFSILILSVNIFSQTSPELIWKKYYVDNKSIYLDTQATKFLYYEVNWYRVRNKLNPCTLSDRVVNYACRWGLYMLNQHTSYTNNFYKHSKFGPEEYHIPGNTSEIIHLVYYDHYPSYIEIVAGLMYGRINSNGIVYGWTQSPGHNACLLESNVSYFGASVYVKKEQETNYWIVYGTINFSFEK